MERRHLKETIESKSSVDENNGGNRNSIKRRIIEKIQQKKRSLEIHDIHI
jgi:hypothetical protein